MVSASIGLVQYLGESTHFSPWMNQTPAGEAFANLRQRNQFATLTAIGLASLLWCASRSEKAPRPWVWLSAAALLATGTAASSSRTGMLQMALLVLLVVAWGDWRKPVVRHMLVAAVIAYCIGPFLLPLLAGLDPSTVGVFARLREGDTLCSSRLTLWSNVIHLIAQKPWLGWGWGELDYAHFVTLYSGPRFCDILDNAHNLPLHLAVELGVPVAVAVCALGVHAVLRLKPWRETQPERKLAWAVLALILLHSMLEYPLWYGPFQIAVILCGWILWSTRAGAPVRGDEVTGIPSSPSPSPSTSRWRPVLLTGCGLVLAAVAYAAWDYHRISQLYKEPSLRAEAYRENTLEKARHSWLFRNQVAFAELTTMKLTRENAPQVHAMALRLLHFSPEPRVVQRLIESAVMLDRNDEALYYLERFKAAFPKDHAAWAQALAIPP
ncbi:MAG: Wzy polymerase domain-containing protein [Pseudomonadota bacterium]